MSDEFDPEADAGAWVPSSLHTAKRSAEPVAAPRLVARLYSGAGLPLRTRILACLVRPMGSLGLAAVASGAFAVLLARGRSEGSLLGAEDAARFSGEQIFELARFVEQVQPDTLQQVAGLVVDSPLGLTALSAAALTLLLRVLQSRAGLAAQASREVPAKDE